MSSGEYIFDTLDPENYNSYWEKCIKTELFNIHEVKEIFKRGLINKAEYDWAIDYLSA